MVEYRKISIKKELGDVIEEFIEKNPRFGFRSVAGFAEDAMRKRAEALGILSQLSRPRFIHFNVYEDHVTLMDNELNRLVDVFFQHDKAYCEECQIHECDHTQFALSLPKVEKTLREQGWIIEDGKVVKGPGDPVLLKV
jgi:hypothetical protein